MPLELILKPSKIDISNLPYDAHVEYARRVEAAESPNSSSVVRSSRGVAHPALTTDSTPVIVDFELARFMSAGRPQRKARYPELPSHLAREIWTGEATLFRMNLVQIWNRLPKLPKRHPSLLVCFKLLRKVKEEYRSTWEGRIAMLGE